MPDDLKDSILSIFEASLDAQLRAVRRLRSGQPEPAPARRRQGLSQVDMAYDILKKARTPLHISQLLARIHSTFHLTVDRESLVSSLTKKIARGDRFIRTDKNTFGLRPEAPGPCSPLGSPSWPTGAPVSLNRVPFTAPSARPWVPWCAWAGAACRASSGPTAASTVVGPGNTSSTPVARGSPQPCSLLCSAAPWPSVPAACSASLSTIPECARRAAPFLKPSISATPCRPLSCQPDPGPALSAGFAAGALASAGPGGLSGSAHSL